MPELEVLISSVYLVPKSLVTFERHLGRQALADAGRRSGEILRCFLRYYLEEMCQQDHLLCREQSVANQPTTSSERCLHPFVVNNEAALRVNAVPPRNQLSHGWKCEVVGSRGPILASESRQSRAIDTPFGGCHEMSPY